MSTGLLRRVLPVIAPLASASTQAPSMPAQSVGLGAASVSAGSWLAFAPVEVAAPAVPEFLVMPLSIAPTIFCQLMFLSGFETMKKIKADGGTGDLSPLQFVSMFTCCSVWSAYGIMMGDMTVTVPNLTGTVLGAYFAYRFHQMATCGSATLSAHYAGAVGILGASVGMYTTLPFDVAADYIGYTGAGLAIVLMASPLATLKSVIRDKNTAALPLLPTLMITANSLSWTLYGALIVHNPIIYFPNGMGFLAALAQLSLYAKYGLPPSADKVSEKLD